LCKCINEMKKTRIFILKSVGMKTDKCLLFLNTKNVTILKNRLDIFIIKESLMNH